MMGEFGTLLWKEEASLIVPKGERRESFDDAWARLFPEALTIQKAQVRPVHHGLIVRSWRMPNGAVVVQSDWGYEIFDGRVEADAGGSSHGESVDDADDISDAPLPRNLGSVKLK